MSYGGTNSHDSSPTSPARSPAGGHHVINMQPGAQQGQFMQSPGIQPDCPPGLEYLTMVNQLLVNQHLELLEIVTGYETANRYSIFNGLGQQVYLAFEESTCCSKNCCGARRGYIMHIVDGASREVIRCRRPFKCCGCCGGCCASCLSICAQETIVEAPPGHVIGYVQQASSCCGMQFYMRDVRGEAIFKTVSQCNCCPCCDQVFEVRSCKTGKRIGSIKKKWGGLAKEMYTDADNFGVDFPVDLDVRMKALILGAVFLIDFMAFENNQPKDKK